MPTWTKEQLEAIEKSGTNIIVSAGAGSGKTAVLSTRVIEKLKQGIHIDELLILTFTNAAAREMKERIRKSIKKVPELKDELDKIDTSYITTFDSFALSIVKKYHYMLKISKNIKIVDNTIINIKKEEILDEVMEEYYNENDSEFIRFINEFCNKDDLDIRNAITSFIFNLERIGDYQKYLDDYIDSYYKKENYENIIKEYSKIIELKISEIKDALNNYGLVATNDEYNKMLEAISGIINYESTDDVIRGVNIVTLPRLSKTTDEVKEAKEVISNLIKELKIVCKYGSLDEIIANIASTKNNVKVIVDIINRFNKKYNKIKLEQELFDFQDIALMAIKIVKDNTFIKDELKNKYKEIMIDEYQDTNDIQETFINLISNNNVYMVGDIKQSIYRFRNANPYLFKSKYDNYSNNNGGYKIDLVKNFRSRKEVLEDINLLFTKVMDDFIGGADYLATHQMVFGNSSYIEKGSTNENNHFEIRYYNYDKEILFNKEEIEIFAVAKDIKEKISNHYPVFDKDAGNLRDITYNDFVILMDRTKDFNTYKKVFEYFGIPLTLYKDESFKDSEDLSLLKNILVLICKIKNKVIDTEFKYALTSLARSYLFNIKDNCIFTWFNTHNYYDNEVYKCFYEIAKRIDSLTNYELFNLIYESTNIYEKMIFIGDIEARSVRLSKVLEIASNLDELGYSYNEVCEYFKHIVDKDIDMKYSVKSDSSDSVKIMTIHKSKGLEYHICYYTGLYKSFNISDIKDKFIFNNKYGFIIPYYKDGQRENVLKVLLKQNYILEEISEKIRLFYVALTRAKEKMILILPNTDKEYLSNSTVVNDNIRLKYRSFADIIYSIKNTLKDYTSIIDMNELNITEDYKYLKKIEEYKGSTNTNLEVNELNIEFITKESNHYSKSINELIDISTSKNIELGLKIHKTLEMLDFKNYNPDLIEDKFIKEKINDLFNNELFKNIKDANVYQEYEFVYEGINEEHHGIIDLMLEYDDHIDIIDYKLKNIVDDNYLKQINGYKEYIESISNKKINAYLYSIMDGKIIALKNN